MGISYNPYEVRTDGTIITNQRYSCGLRKADVNGETRINHEIRETMIPGSLAVGESDTYRKKMLRKFWGVEE